MVNESLMDKDSRTAETNGLNEYFVCELMKIDFNWFTNNKTESMFRSADHR